jgi:hypothetical protein
MTKIYSKIDGRLLHQINRLFDIQNGRIDLSEDKEFLQISVLKLDKHKTFKPHKHIWKQVEPESIAQESWIVIKGQVKCIFYDLDDTLIHEDVLNPGDCSITYYGGHNYYVNEDCIVYEVKTGPYFGMNLDKLHI